MKLHHMITIFMSYNVEESHSLEVVSVNMLKYPSILHSYKNKHNELLQVQKPFGKK